jgi:hypothetical protein
MSTRGEHRLQTVSKMLEVAERRAYTKPLMS